MLKYPFYFTKLEGHFIRRINRFVIEVEIKGRLKQAYLANPGRLWELLLPGRELLLVPAPPTNKIPYIVLACRKDNLDVLLHTHLSNKIISNLINERKLPSFSQYRVAKEEPACGKHRFDLLLEDRNSGNAFYLEIKSCTLFDGKIVMFPDAVTVRGTKHLYKLQELAKKGIKTGCLFVVMNPQARFFLPAYHIDPVFATVLQQVRDDVHLTATGIGFNHDFTIIDKTRQLSIPFDILDEELQDSGAYLLLIHMAEEKQINVGSRGYLTFKKGFYVYTGSAKRNLSKRIARHKRKRKRKHWHIDFLVEEAAAVTPVQIISSDSLECDLAKSLHIIADLTVQDFGSSDCRCQGHLFYFAQNPLHNTDFINLVQYYRIRRLEKKLLY